MIKIQDNFLPNAAYHQISSFFQSNNVPWYYEMAITDVEPAHIDNYQLIHPILNTAHFQPPSPFLENLNPLLAHLPTVNYFIRIKLNLNPRTSKPYYSGWHTDTLTDNTTSIYYLNDNNGGTQFEGGMVVESVGNRFVTFPSRVKHRGVSATDVKARFVLNLNYAEPLENMR